MIALEKAARAAMAHEWGEPITDEMFDADNRAYWEAHVRAVLMAVREPDGPTIDAAYRAPHEMYEPPLYQDIWTAMIDAILNEDQAALSPDGGRRRLQRSSESASVPSRGSEKPVTHGGEP